MGAGKYLAIIAAILAILGTFLFALIGVTPDAVSGLGFFQNISDNFQYAPDMAALWGLDDWWGYLTLIILLIFSISFIFLLAGYKSRGVAFFGSIFPLIVGIIFVIGIASDIQIMDQIALTMGTMMGEEQLADVIPVIVKLDEYGLGIFLIIGAGVLGIISAALPREDIY